ncbi:MAG: Clp protease N-terminal domain-containing protein [Solirubrobacteraceae bacterium]
MREEARRRGDRKVGTEHLLVALLDDPVLAGAVGSDAQRARSALDEMDREALVAIGMAAPPEVPPLPAGDPRDVPARPTIRTVLHKRLRLTPSAANVLRESSKGMRRGHRHPGPQHVLAAILELQRPDPAAGLLATLGVEPAVVRERLGA